MAKHRAAKNLPAHKRRKFGEHRSCKKCEADIEFHGRETGWLDRGGNTSCGVYYDRHKQEFVRPTGKHAPYEG